MTKDYYSILGVSKTATEEEIKTAYRKKAIEFHPDKQVGKTDAEKKDAEEKFKDVAEAYQILSDPQKRQRYDNFGTVDGNFSGGFSTADALREFMRSVHNFSFGGKIDDFFSDMKPQKRGTDMVVKVHLTFEEVYKLGKKTIKYNPYVPCDSCNGTGSSDGETHKCTHCKGMGVIVNTERRGFGWVQSGVECPHCHGTGVGITTPCKKCNGLGIIRKETELTIDLPKGITNAAYYDLPGYGNACVHSAGENGNLRLVFLVEDSPNFTLSTDNPYDINYTMEVGILDCITGCTKTFTHVDGKEYRININQGTPNGYIIRLRGLGLCYRNGSRGYLNVRIKTKMPSKLSKDDKATIEKLKSSKNFK